MESTMPLGSVIDARFEALQHQAQEVDWFHALDMEPVEYLGAIQAAAQLVCNRFSETELREQGLHVVPELVRRARVICFAAEVAARELATIQTHEGLARYVANCRSKRLLCAIRPAAAPDDPEDHQGERVDR